MILVDATSGKLEGRITQSIPAFTPFLHWYVSWVEIDKATQAIVDMGTARGFFDNTPDQDLVPLPAAGRARKVLTLIVASYGAAERNVEIMLDGANSYDTNLRLIRCTLASFDQLQFVDGTGWRLLDKHGSVKTQLRPNLGGGDLGSFQHSSGSGGLNEYRVAGKVNGLALTTGAPSANVLRTFPFVAPIERAAVVDQLAFNVTTAVAGNARIGLYQNIAVPGRVYPGVLLSGSADISTGSTGVKTHALTQELEPGELYWLALVGSAAPTLRCLAMGGMHAIHGLDTGLGTASNVGLSVAFTYAALPSVFPTSGLGFISAVPLPVMAYRLSS